MNKGRLEAFSDGVFAIVMTLLIFDVKVPAISGPVTGAAIWHALALTLPLIITYVLSFVVLSAIWINHHFLFQTFTLSINRQLNLLNLLYLLFIVFVPFSAHLLGTYFSQPGAIIYGVNIFCVVLISRLMSAYIVWHPDLGNDEVSRRMTNQGRARGTISLVSYALGIAASFLYVPVSLFFYAFPVIFNIIPGSLDLAEKTFGFSLD